MLEAASTSLVEPDGFNFMQVVPPRLTAPETVRVPVALVYPGATVDPGLPVKAPVMLPPPSRVWPAGRVRMPMPPALTVAPATILMATLLETLAAFPRVNVPL